MSKTKGMKISIKRLPVSGWWHIRGQGPCNWAQVPDFPCDEATLRQHAFPEAGEDFIRAVMLQAREEVKCE